MSLQHLKRVSLTIALVLVCQVSFGALTFFSSRTAFVGALPSFGIEDFEDNAGVVSYPAVTPAAGSDLVFLGSGITGGYSPANVVFNLPGPLTTAGGAGGRYNTTQPISLTDPMNYLLAPGESITLNFSAPINALGFETTDLGDYSTVPFTVKLGSDTISFPSTASPSPFGHDGNGTLVDANGVPIPAGANNARNIFYGFTSTSGFTSATFENGNELYGLDDIIVSAVSDTGAIPEPASVSVWLAMMLSGLALVRRKR